MEITKKLIDKAYDRNIVVFDRKTSGVLTDRLKTLMTTVDKSIDEFYEFSEEQNKYYTEELDGAMPYGNYSKMILGISSCKNQVLLGCI